MEDSSETFVATLRERLANDDTISEPVTTGITVEEHSFEELDERTQTAVSKMFETQRIAKRAQNVADDAYSTCRVKALQL